MSSPEGAPYTLQHHMTILFGDTQFHCSKCDKTFSQERNLKTYGHTYWEETRSIHQMWKGFLSKSTPKTSYDYSL